VRPVVVGRPLERQRLARPVLELEVTRRKGLRELSSGEVGAAGVRGEHLGCRTAEGAVAGHEAREGRRDERSLLIRDPLFAENPADAAHLVRVFWISAPGPNSDLADVIGKGGVALSRRARFLR